MPPPFSFRATPSEMFGATFGARLSEICGATFRSPPKPLLLAGAAQKPFKKMSPLSASVCAPHVRSCRLEPQSCARAAPRPASLSSCNSAHGPPQQGKRRQGQGRRGRGQGPRQHGQGRRGRGQGRATLNGSSPRSTWISTRVSPLRALSRLGLGATLAVTSRALPPLLDMSTSSAMRPGCIDAVFFQAGHAALMEHR